jgi:uncharacterized protein (DUF362 family)/NAD-dependent dihydropyrimidine dehydrogenase PreA subunit
MYMNTKVAVRKCAGYDLKEISELISDIFQTSGGPAFSGKKVLLKPNILSDHEPEKCISTHPVVVEAMIRFLQQDGATVFVGDSPAVHTQRFSPVKSGIRQICESTGAAWVDFSANPVEVKLRKGKIKVASIVKEVDLIISLPKFKNHELVYFTGAVKNTLGIVPGFNKAKMHAIHRDRDSFSSFLADLNEAVTPEFFLMDAIMGMEGPGPGRGVPVHIGVLIGSTNPVALDIIASSIAGYDPNMIPTTRISLLRGKWLQSAEDIVYDGPELNSLVKKDFRKVPLSGMRNISVKFLMNRVSFLRKIDRRPVFDQNKCSGCHKCVRICPVGAIKPRPQKKNQIILTDSKCIRCYCCSEVCGDNAVEIRRKLFGT